MERKFARENVHRDYLSDSSLFGSHTLLGEGEGRVGLNAIIIHDHPPIRASGGSDSTQCLL